mmetsp:Transcript_9023/g.23562  ORF Transcript_9023/g.23562 Transcript_9023/m.23562 type:complete len:229 (-) Transcript_9023:1513-2199(-)
MLDGQGPVLVVRNLWMPMLRLGWPQAAGASRCGCGGRRKLLLHSRRATRRAGYLRALWRAEVRQGMLLRGVLMLVLFGHGLLRPTPRLLPVLLLGLPRRLLRWLCGAQEAQAQPLHILVVVVRFHVHSQLPEPRPSEPAMAVDHAPFEACALELHFRYSGIFRLYDVRVHGRVPNRARLLLQRQRMHQKGSGRSNNIPPQRPLAAGCPALVVAALGWWRRRLVAALGW